MIVAVRSTLPTFKAVAFREGLNVLLADVTPSSTRRQTRNSAGKTSLVEIIHFLLGSEADKASVFKRQELLAHAFTGVLRIGGALVAVTRRCDDDRKVAFADVAAAPDWAGHVGDATFPGRTVDLDTWRSYLGEGWFDLPPAAGDLPANGVNRRRKLPPYRRPILTPLLQSAAVAAARRSGSGLRSRAAAML